MENKVNKNEVIVSLAKDILRKIKKDNTKLSNILLQAAELSHLVGLDGNIDYFKEGSQKVEKSQVYLDTFSSTIEAAKDPNISITSANPTENVGWSAPKGNYLERKSILLKQQNAVQTIGSYKSETYEFVMKVYYTYLFGQEVGSILDSYKNIISKNILMKFSQFKSGFETISQNINGQNSRNWAAAASECRNILIILSSELWKRKKENFKRSKGKIIKVGGKNKKNKLIAYIDTKINSSNNIKKSKKEKLYAIIHEIFDIGGKQKRNINKNEVSTSVVDLYIFLAELINCTDLKPTI